MDGDHPNIMDLIESGKLDYIISTSSKGRIPARHSVQIRRKELVACRSQPLEQRFFEIMRNTEHFASRLHLRPEHGVNIVQLLKAEQSSGRASTRVTRSRSIQRRPFPRRSKLP